VPPVQRAQLGHKGLPVHKGQQAHPALWGQRVPSGRKGHKATQVHQALLVRLGQLGRPVRKDQWALLAGLAAGRNFKPAASLSCQQESPS